jgi:signal transduction histidine kinase
LRTAQDDRGRARIEVEDNGPGIAADHVARLFDSFFTTRKGGLGIGLSLSRSIVEAHGGEIAFTATGRGALFAVTLPAAAAPAGPAVRPAAHTHV